MGGERRLAVACAVLLALSLLAAATHSDRGGDRTRLIARPDLSALGLADVTTTTASITTTVAPTTTTTPPPPPPPSPVTTAPARTRAAGALGVPALRPPPVPAGLAPYRGLGTWVDVYDWSRTYTGGKPVVGPADVDRMADRGVQTLYIQASKWDSSDHVVDPDLLLPMLARAKARGLKVVAWYLPTLEDPQRDLQRMVAIAALRDVDSLGVDIEARNVGDVDERNRRLVELSGALRQALPGRTIAAIVLPPVVLDVVNPNYWPSFPYRVLAPHYDVWMTMGYWTNRKPSSGYRDAYRYTKENVDRLRAHVGADVPVHPIGGLGAATTPADVEAYRKAAIDTHSIGGSLYDWRTTKADSWPGMQGFRG